MAVGSFNVVAQLQLAAPTNLRSIAGAISSGLKGISVDVDVRITRGATAGINNLSNALTSLSANLKNVVTDATDAANAISRLGSAFGNVQNISSNIAGNVGKATQAIQVHTKATEEAASASEEFGKQAGLAARRFAAFSLSAGSVVALVAAIKTGVSSAIEFQSAMVKLEQIGGRTQSQLADVATEITRVATSFGVSSTELVHSVANLQKLGLSAADTKIALEALAEASLSPSFGGFAKATEGAIAAISQFKLSATELRDVIGSVNAVSNSYAVDSGEIVDAIRRSGAAFKATGGNLNEFIALFTAVKSTTRESGESISTGLRTIFTRIQRNDTVEALRDLGINLRFTAEEAKKAGDSGLRDQFVGAYEAVRRLSEGLNSLRSTDPRFAAVVEQLGGYRQVSKALPLLQEFKTVQNALTVAQYGGLSATTAAVTQQEALANKISKVKEEFLALIRAFADSAGFKSFVNLSLSFASSLIKISEAVIPLVPLLTTLAAIKIGRGLIDFPVGAISGLTGAKAPTKVNSGGFINFAKGGLVPGTGGTDSVPAMLTPGERVIPKGYNDGGDVYSYETTKKDVKQYAFRSEINPVTGRKKQVKFQTGVADETKRVGGTPEELAGYQKIYNDIVNSKEYPGPEAGKRFKKITGLATSAPFSQRYENQESLSEFPGGGIKKEGVDKAITDKRGILENKDKGLASIAVPFPSDIEHKLGLIALNEFSVGGESVIKPSFKVLRGEGLSGQGPDKKTGAPGKGPVQALLDAGAKDDTLIYGKMTEYILSDQKKKSFSDNFSNRVIDSINKVFQDFPEFKDVPDGLLKLDKSAQDSIRGYLLEPFITGITKVPLQKGQANFDYEGDEFIKKRAELAKFIQPEFNSNLVDVRAGGGTNYKIQIIYKFLNRQFKGYTPHEIIGPQNIETPVINKATGGLVPGVGNTDSVPAMLEVGSYVLPKSATAALLSNKGYASGGAVPAMLTPGELVIDKSTANKIGGSRLEKLRTGYASGGLVQHFATGGGAQPQDIQPINLNDLRRQLGFDAFRLARSVNATVTEAGAAKNRAELALQDEAIRVITQEILARKQGLDPIVAANQAQKEYINLLGQRNKNVSIDINSNKFVGTQQGVNEAQLAGRQTGLDAQATKSRLSVENIRASLTRVGSVAALLGTQYGAAGLEKLAGTPERAAGVSETSFANLSGAAGGLGGVGQGAAIGAALGSVIPGVGTTAGGVIGGVAGLINGAATSFKEAGDRLAQVKFDKAAEALNKFANDLSSGVIAATPQNITAFGDALEKQRKDVVDKTQRETSGIFSNASFADFSKELNTQLRRSFEGNLANVAKTSDIVIQQIVSRQSQGGTKTVDPNAVLKEFSAGFGKTASQILAISGVPQADIQRNTRNQVLAATRQQQADVSEGNRSALLFNFDALIKAVETATNGLENLNNKLELSATLLAGKGTAVKPENITTGLSLIGAPDNKDFLESLQRIAPIAGPNKDFILEQGKQFDALSRTLPEALNQALRETRGLGEGNIFQTRVTDILKAAGVKDVGILAGVSKSIPTEDKEFQKDIQQGSPAFAKKITTAIGGDEFNTALATFAKGAQSVSEKYVKDLSESFARIVAINNEKVRIDDLSLELDRIRASRAADANGRAASFERNISLEQLQAPLNNQIGRLLEAGGLRPQAAGNPEDIARAVTNLLPTVEQARQRRDSTVGTKDFPEAEKNFQGLVNQSNNLRAALSLLADTSKTTAAAQKKLAENAEELNSKRSFAEKLLLGGQEELQKLTIGSRLAIPAYQNNVNLGALPTPVVESIIHFFDSLGKSVIPALSKPGGPPVTAEDAKLKLFDTFLANRTASGLGGLANVNVADQDKLKANVEAAIAKAKAAETQLVKLDTVSQKEFFTTLNDNFKVFFSDLSKNLNVAELNRLTANQTTALNQENIAGKAAGQAKLLRDSGITNKVGETLGKPENVKAVNDLIEANNQLTASKKRNFGAELIGGTNFDYTKPIDNIQIEKLKNELSQLGLILSEKEAGDLGDVLRTKTSGSRKGPLGEPLSGASGEDYINTINEFAQKRQEALSQTVAEKQGVLRTNLGSTVSNTDFGNIVAKLLSDNGNKIVEALGSIGQKMADVSTTFDEAKKRLEEANKSLELNPVYKQQQEEARQQEGFAAAAINQATGGIVYAHSGYNHPGKPQGTDTVPAWLTPGEQVTRSESASPNRELLSAINAKRGKFDLSDHAAMYAAEGKDTLETRALANPLLRLLLYHPNFVSSVEENIFGTKPNRTVPIVDTPGRERTNQLILQQNAIDRFKTTAQRATEKSKEVLPDATEHYPPPYPPVIDAINPVLFGVNANYKAAEIYGKTRNADKDLLYQEQKRFKAQNEARLIQDKKNAEAQERLNNPVTVPAAPPIVNLGTQRGITKFPAVLPKEDFENTYIPPPGNFNASPVNENGPKLSRRGAADFGPFSRTQLSRVPESKNADFTGPQPVRFTGAQNAINAQYEAGRRLAGRYRSEYEPIYTNVADSQRLPSAPEPLSVATIRGTEDAKRQAAGLSTLGLSGRESVGPISSTESYRLQGLADANKPALPVGLSNAALRGAEDARRQAAGLPVLGLKSTSLGDNTLTQAEFDSGTYFAKGGPIGQDNIPIYASAGEYVMSANAVKNIGVGNLDSANRYYATGGAVGASKYYDNQGTNNAQANIGGAGLDKSIAAMNTSFTAFDTSVNTLVTALAKIPSTIELTAKHSVEVIVNGLEVLTALQPQIEQIVIGKTGEALDKLISDKFPDAGKRIA